jgi:hypothetical protein
MTKLSRRFSSHLRAARISSERPFLDSLIRKRAVIKKYLWDQFEKRGIFWRIEEEREGRTRKIEEKKRRSYSVVLSNGFYLFSFLLHCFDLSMYLLLLVLIMGG